MFAVAVTKQGELELAQVPKPTLGTYQALLKTEVAYLYNMTYRKLIEGQLPGVEQYSPAAWP